ncbi:hypothetical protein SISSUDRAFT_1066290 [Sistotremastrum suecicum HHB10207 ss-3]|uniref:Uncharacterized protein n=1 Tax=Sistotremastrum suecicum HHB10207 ss-3 TaxID=1314776 RepID=A0A165YGW9_9AGAM|nr:hypothetical protein SISSUDRAFT_1066290 [Sistotremastrum suecicum HHB10207 ss-3]
MALDPYTREILDRVRQSPFGPDGQPPMTGGAELSTSSGIGQEREREGGTIDPFVQGPTNEWQKQVLSDIIARQSHISLFASAGHQTNAVLPGLPTGSTGFAGPSRSTESRQHPPQSQRTLRPISTSPSHGHQTPGAPSSQTQGLQYDTAPDALINMPLSLGDKNLYSILKEIFPENAGDMEYYTHPDGWGHLGGE